MQTQLPKPPKTVQKTIRFPAELAQQVANEIDGVNYTFSAFVVASVRFTLKSIFQSEEQP